MSKLSRMLVRASRRACSLANYRQFSVSITRVKESEFNKNYRGQCLGVLFEQLFVMVSGHFGELYAVFKWFS